MDMVNEVRMGLVLGLPLVWKKKLEFRVCTLFLDELHVEQRNENGVWSWDGTRLKIVSCKEEEDGIYGLYVFLQELHIVQRSGND